ncbi:PLP-dependent aminotransferase family protein [Naasia lichenicola]|uniref:Aminotransferase class I/II-fold pyridoxal phosphate-dependent enzyme n=1 Tax=Naasia lichenicola TaxID=2565933 RepID=A0A4S4FMW1_9MICO|nr:aminotransferase class I/II-fold pyridoxal phosphate-dependent enzyme [Naasia lichenicola]THG31769.1 aminotransferase class I/II-fold pyridoxal phosphate-dependent enzyme [Naasia lichenicola]
MSSLADHIEEPTSRAIAAAVARLVTSGELAPGDRLPTVRDLATELGVSPATVSNAWQALSRAGLVVSRGRSGTTVRGAPRDWLPQRYQDIDGSGETRLDLSRGTPDPELLPSLQAALTRVPDRAQTSSYQAKPDIPELHDLLRDRWPSRVESLTVTNGALDALDRVFGTLLTFGDRVLVESPGFPPILDLLEHYGASAIGVSLDADGLLPDSLASGLSRHPKALVMQPRAQNPTGASMTTARAEALARVLNRTSAGERVIVIEDDHSGEISTRPVVTLASWLPDRVLHIRSFAKSHGPDLRIGALGGPRSLVDRVVSRRLLGAGWTSRMTQRILLELLTDPVPVEQVAAARSAYAERQRTMSSALARHGIDLPLADGLNFWLPVHDERAALVSLAAEGIRVAPGGPFLPADSRTTEARVAEARGGDPRGAHVRVTVGIVREDHASIAAALAAASTAG